METFMKLTRINLDRAEPETRGDPGSSKGQKIPIQKTQSFEEKKKAQNWFQRQFIRKMNRDYESGDLDHATAVAAAAFAVSSQKIPEIPQQKKTERSLSKTRSKTEGTTGGSKRFAGSFKLTDGRGKKEPTSPARDEKVITRVPSKKKTLSFRELLKTKSDTTAPEIPAPVQSEPLKPPTSTKPAVRQTEADAWEKAELEKIKQKYEKLKETIDYWENKKKKEAKRKLNMQESELEQRRVKAMDKFRNDIYHIDQIVGGAREQADAKRRKEELKVNDKANRIRTKGRLPGACSCFLDNQLFNIYGLGASLNISFNSCIYNSILLPVLRKSQMGLNYIKSTYFIQNYIRSYYYSTEVNCCWKLLKMFRNQDPLFLCDLC